MRKSGGWGRVEGEDDGTGSLPFELDVITNWVEKVAGHAGALGPSSATSACSIRGEVDRTDVGASSLHMCSFTKSEILSTSNRPSASQPTAAAC